LGLTVTGKVRPAVGEGGRAETPTNVFICYRRDDSAGSAGRIHDRLAHELGSDRLFMDVDAIPLGMNFVKILRDEVAKCGVLLAQHNGLDLRHASFHTDMDRLVKALRSLLNLGDGVKS
jgi:hypothetical protein